MKKILLALRLFRNYRLYAVVNTLGLALSLTCVITIARYLHSEFSVESMHSKHERIYGVVSQNLNSNVRIPNESRNMNNIEGFIDLSEDPSVVAKTTVIRLPKESVSSGQSNFAINVMTVDSSFTKIFDFPTRVGSLENVSRSIDQAAISENMVQKMFADSDPIGQTITVKGSQYTISAIIAPSRSKTTLTFDVIVPSVDWRKWMNIPAQYILAPKNFDQKAFNDKYPKHFDLYLNSNGQRFSIAPLCDFYFDRSIENHNLEMAPQGNMDSLNVILIVAILIFAIGVFNFINIYTVLMLKRSREVGVKKAFGASTTSITGGIYAENLTLVGIATALGWVLALAGADFAASTLGIPTVENIGFDLTLTTTFLIALPLLTTIYPYIKYRTAKPITSLREINSSGRSIVSRAIFLVVQYTITIIMTIAAIYFVRQMQYILSADLGYKHGNIIAARLFSDTESLEMLTDEQWKEHDKRQAQSQTNYKLVSDELARNPIIKRFTCNEPPNNIFWGNDYFKAKASAEGEFKSIALMSCGAGFFDMYDIKLLKGREWNDSIDIFEQYKCIVNETFLRDFGITDFTTAIVQPSDRLWYSANNEQEQELMRQNPPYMIVGVVRDFQIGHMRAKTPPLMLYYTPDNQAYQNPSFSRLLIEPVENKTAETITLLAKLHSQLGNGAFTYTMVDDEITAQYEEDRKVTNIYTTFAVIAILIGSMGLFSLSLYDVQQRYREIALRRINGATIRQIVMLLLRKYYLLLAVAFVVATPMAYFAIEWYMQDFVNRAPLSWWIFAVAALLTATISLLTVIYQTNRAASSNPATAIKSE